MIISSSRTSANLQSIHSISSTESETFNEWLRVLKKFRGKKRYFRNIWRQVNNFSLELDNESWFEFYHIHLDDWEGVGNGSVRDKDSGQDAVYIHTPNPNRDSFPLKVEKLNWNCNIPTIFSDLIESKEFNVAHYKSESEGCYFIHSNCQVNNL